MVDPLKLATEAVALTGPQYDELRASIEAIEDDLVEAAANASEAGMPLLRAIVCDVLRTVRTARESLKVARFGLGYSLGATALEEALDNG